MKIARLILALLIGCCLFDPVFSQSEPQAVKFDEYNEETGINERELITKAKRFGDRILREPETKKGMMVYYSQIPRKAHCGWSSNRIFELKRIASRVFSRAKPQTSKIVWIEGNFKDFAAIEFWLVPQNAQPPPAAMGVDFDYGICCPAIKILGESMVSGKRRNLIYTLEIGGKSSIKIEGLEWKISSGKIAKGQGTKRISIDLRKAESKETSIEVKVKGLDFPCVDSTSLTVKIL